MTTQNIDEEKAARIAKARAKIRGAAMAAPSMAQGVPPQAKVMPVQPASPTPPPAVVAVAAAPATASRFARPANLHGMEKLSAWIREQAREILATEVGEKTRAQYERNGTRLDAGRVIGCPVDLSPYESRKATYYAYRAAVRWHAATRGVQAVRDYDNARKAAGGNSSPESDAAWQRVLYAASDLVAYPKDVRLGPPSDTLTHLGLADAKPEGAPSRAKREGRNLPPRETAKLKAANGIARKNPNWRDLVWSRLVAVGSPWLDHTAVAALTGARPEELRFAEVRKNSHGMLEIRIAGAKVSKTKGQPWRTFTLGDDASAEYAHLASKTDAGWKVVDLPPGVTDYPDAFSAALARAGAHVLVGSDRLSGYVYRHAFASDMKADGASKEQIAMALGHAVTRTQDAYGRAIGGVSGRRIFSVEAARDVKVTHDTRYTGAPKTPQVETPLPPITWETPGYGV